MNNGSSQALSQEIQQSAQKILKHLNEFELNDGSESSVQRESDIINLFSTLQTEKSESLLQDVNKWTEYRRESYQKFEDPLLNQVENNQKFAKHVTNEAIPNLQKEMDEYDAKLLDAKLKLHLMSENMMKEASNVVEGSKNQGPINEPPQLKLEIQKPPPENSAEKERSKIEYENEIIQQLRKRQEYFVNALNNFDKEIAAIQSDLKNSREDTQNLENENKKLKKEIEELRKKSQLLIGGEIRMEIGCFDTCFKIEKKEPFEILLDKSKYLEINEDSEKNFQKKSKEELEKKLKEELKEKLREELEEKLKEELEKKLKEELEEKLKEELKEKLREELEEKLKDELEEKLREELEEKLREELKEKLKEELEGKLKEELEEKLKEESKEKLKEESKEKLKEELGEKMASFIHYTNESVTFEPNDEYEILPRSEFDKYLKYIKNNTNEKENKDLDEMDKKDNNENKNKDIDEMGKKCNNNKNENKDFDEMDEKGNNNQKFQYTNHANKNANQIFDPSSITSEISYEMKVNDKNEIVFDLTDESGNNLFGNISPESVEEMQNEIQKDIQHLISINAEAPQLDDNQTNPNEDKHMNNTMNPFDVSINRNPSFLHNQNSMKKNSNEKSCFSFTNDPFSAPQPIVPIGIRQKEDRNGNIGYRIFFKQNNDALILDTKVNHRTKDGLIIFNNPSPNILTRIEDGFSTEFISRCRENPNLNFILRPYRPEGSKERVVGLCENNRDSYRSNFLSEKRNTPCVWSSFPVRPPPPIFRSNNRPQTTHLHSNQTGNQSSLDQTFQKQQQKIQQPHQIPYLSPQQIYQMSRSSTSSIAARKNAVSKVGHSYNSIQKNAANENLPSPRKIIQATNGHRIISPDSKSRQLNLSKQKKQTEYSSNNKKYDSMRKLNRSFE